MDPKPWWRKRVAWGGRGGRGGGWVVGRGDAAVGVL